METEINKVRQNERNPRKISKSKLSDLIDSILSLPEMLQYRTIVVNREGIIIGGNMRHKSLLAIAQMSEGDLMTRLKRIEKSGNIESKIIYWKKWQSNPRVFVEIADMDEEEQIEFIVKDNGDYGEWDRDMVDKLYSDIYESYVETNVPNPVTVKEKHDVIPSKSDETSGYIDYVQLLDDDDEDQNNDNNTDINSDTQDSYANHGRNDYEEQPSTESPIRRGPIEPPLYCDYLRISGYNIPVTEREKERYLNLLDAYCDENGISYGFINYIKNGLGINK